MKTLGKKWKLLGIFLFVIFWKILGFTIEGLALGTGIYRPHLAKAIGSTNWVVTQRNLRFFGAQDHKICQLFLSIFYSFLLETPICLSR